MADTLAAQWWRAYPREEAEPDPGRFELGLCMAGAISAGAYTAGVLDFLIEALDGFEAENARLGASGPLHHVTVKVLGGASAGGMCAAIAGLFLDRRFRPVRSLADAEAQRENPLWQAWVEMIDIDQLLRADDLPEGAPIRSALDCTVLDRIVDTTIARVATLPPVRRPWLADPVRVILTLANLRGVPYALRFSGREGATSHFMWSHADSVCFTVAADAAASATAAPATRPGEVAVERGDLAQGAFVGDLFRAAALGTGAFPVALRPREVTRLRDDYAYRALLTPAGAFGDAPPENPALGLPDWPAEMDERYRMLVLDGGAMNNEPLDLVRRALAGWGGRNLREGERANRAVLMVDPFVEPGLPGPDHETGLHATLLPLFDALVREARFKPEDLALAADPDVYSRFLIAPSRGGDWSGKSAIAGGYLGGFMGFFSRAYRAHDFLLGRRNCQSFLRKYFVLPEGNPLFSTPGWTEEARVRFGILPRGDTRRHLPIVPLCSSAEGLDLGAPEAAPEPTWPAGAFRAADVKTRIEERVAAVTAQVDATILTPRFRKGAEAFVGRMVGEKIAEQAWPLRVLANAFRKRIDEIALRALERAWASALRVPGETAGKAASDAIAKAVAELDRATPRPR
ncbi:patatin-like phospholipase family protein [Elioraea rosea]|uniref:patatin-like phospholipase family protein n=1 Tax=Elioraea rosea TaxID=2492390 RepID=UPI0011832462|nr:patatin-like phospholipase family protein [Elioraea rosea]